MNTVCTPVPEDHPLMKAWTAYTQTEEYANTKKWAGPIAHPDDTFWAVFLAGFDAAMAAQGKA